MTSGEIPWPFWSVRRNYGGLSKRRGRAPRTDDDSINQNRHSGRHRRAHCLEGMPTNQVQAANLQEAPLKTAHNRAFRLIVRLLKRNGSVADMPKEL